MKSVESMTTLSLEDISSLKTRRTLNAGLSEHCSLKIEYIVKGIENEKLNLPHYEALKNIYEAENVLIHEILQTLP